MTTERPRQIGKNVVLVLALVGVGFVLAWVRFRPYLGDEGRYTDGVASYDVTEVGSVRYAIWESPESLGAEVSTADREGRASVSPDGRQLVFAVGERGLGADLWIADLVEGRPHGARPLRALNTGADELAPCFGTDALYFASDRPGTHGGLDLWRADWDGFDFGTPTLLEGALASPADDTDPAPLPGGGLVFASKRDSGRLEHFDLYLARPDAIDEAGRPDWSIEPLVALNTGFDEREPATAGDGRVLFFASDREGGAGGFDLYRTGLDLDGWSPPEPLAALNGPGADRAPAPSRDGFTLVYATEFADTGSDLMRAHSRELFRRPGDPVGLKELLILLLLLLLALLAWGAKHWRGLDVVYRCFLISLALHLLLLWWFREVYPEPNDLELAAREEGVKVRLVTRADGAREGDAERAGQLAVERASESEQGEPQRAELADAQLAAAAPSAARLARPAPELGGGPERASAEAERRAASVADRAEVATPAEQFALRSGAAAELALDARAALSTERAAPAAPSASGVASAIEVAAEAPTAAAVAALAPAELGAAPARASAPVERADAGRAAPAVAVASPEESFVRRASATGEVALEATADVAAAARSTDALPARRGSVGTPDLVTAVAPAGLTGAVDRGAAPSVAGPERPALAVERTVAGGLAVAVATPADESAPRASAPAGGDGPAAELVASAFERPDRAADGPARSGAEFALPSAVAAASPRAARLDAPLAAPTPRRRTSALPERGGTTPAVAVATPTEAATGRPAEANVQRGAAGGAVLALTPAATASERAGRLTLPTRRGAALDLPTTAPGALDLPELSAVTLVADDAPRRSFERTPYASRSGAAKVRALDVLGGSQETEAAVAGGLAYLASVQTRGGWWGSEDDYDGKYHHVVVGKTGLCLLAFLGAGHRSDSETLYSRNVERGLDFLLEVQERNGHFGDCSSYGHGIATYALAEAYALTGAERLRPALERAVRRIESKQNRRDDRRLRGGWGYYYADSETFDRWPRVSITSWQVMALESARIGGLTVDDEVLELAHEFISNSWDQGRGAFRYSHDPSRLSSSYDVLPGSTPAALFVLSLFDEDIGGDEFRDAREFVTSKAPDGYRHTSIDAFVYRARGNLYFWYYGSLAMLRVGGDDWRRWNTAMKETLLPSQNEDGSWEPISSYAEYAGDDRRDKSYSTALCVLTLEVYYRYFTPLLSHGGNQAPASGRAR